MNSIPELYNEVNKVIKDIVATLPTCPFNKKDVKVFEKLIKQWETLEPKIQEETLVLKDSRKDTSPTLVRYNARFQVIVNQLKELHNQITTRMSPRTVEITGNPSEDFKLFRSACVRELCYGYEEVMNEKVTLKEIVKAYYRWVFRNTQKSRVSLTEDQRKDFKELCEKTFGDSRGKDEYAHIRVFLDEDELEEFDKEHNQR